MTHFKSLFMKSKVLFAICCLLGLYSFGQYKEPVYNDIKFKKSFAYYTSYWNRMLEDVKWNLPDSMCFNQISTVSFKIDTDGKIINYQFDAGDVAIGSPIDPAPQETISLLKRGFDSLLHASDGKWVPATQDGKPVISKTLWFLFSMVHYGTCAEKHSVKSYTQSLIWSPQTRKSFDTHFLGLVEFRGGAWNSMR
jgi:hypothetical protein